MEKSMAFALTDWFLDLHDGCWRLHGNKAFEGGDPRFQKGEMIVTSSITDIAINGDGILFESKNSRYFCHLADTLDERYDWFFDRKLWEIGLDEKEIRYYIHCLKRAVEKRRIREKQAVTELPADEYCLLAFGDQYKNYLADAVHCRDGQITHYNAVEISDYRSEIMIIDMFKEIDSLIYYRVTSKNTIKIKSAAFWYMTIFATNYGKEDLLLDTVYGRIFIPHDGKLHKISGKSIAGKIAVYREDEIN